MHATIIIYTLVQIHTHTTYPFSLNAIYTNKKKRLKIMHPLHPSVCERVRDRGREKCDCLVCFARYIFSICSLYNSWIFLALVENRRKRTYSIKGRRRRYIWNVLHSLHCSQMNYGRFRCFFHSILLPVCIGAVCASICAHVLFWVRLCELFK